MSVELTHENLGGIVTACVPRRGRGSLQRQRWMATPRPVAGCRGNRRL